MDVEEGKRKQRQKLQTLKALSYPNFCLSSSFVVLTGSFLLFWFLRLEAMEEDDGVILGIFWFWV